MNQRTNHCHNMVLWLRKPAIAMVHSVLAGFLPVSSLSAEPLVHVDAQLCELPADAEMPDDLIQIAKAPKSDNVSVPRVTTHYGKPAKISISREFQVAGKGSFPIGLFLTVHVEPDGAEFQYSVDFERSEFVGFAERSTTQAPIFNIQKIHGIEGRCAGNQAVRVDLGEREDKQIVSEPGDQNRVTTVRRKLIAILTFSKAS